MGFTEAMENESIAIKEARAIWYSLIHFKDKVRNSYCTFYCDNQSVCWGFTKQMSRCRKLNEFIIAIIRLCKRLNIQFEVVWTPTLYQLADKPSREISLNEEFLPHDTFRELERVAGFRCTVDTMASDTNYKCPKYIKWRDDNLHFRNCIGFDFMSFDINELQNQKLYCFPPKNFLDHTADHLLQFFSETPFILIYHQFDEIPLSVVRLLSLPSTRKVTLTSSQPVTFIPSEKRTTIQFYNSNTATVLGTPNIRPRLTNAIINDPNPNFRYRNRTKFRAPKILSVIKNIK